MAGSDAGKILTGAGSNNTDGVIKILFGERGDVDGGLGPNPWQFSLSPGVEIQITPPTPFVYDDATCWPNYVRAQDDTELYTVDGTYGLRLIEQNIDKQVNVWRWIIDYARSDASADEQLNIRYFNPASGFSESGQVQLLKEQLIDEGSVLLETIAIDDSIPEAGVGSGYQIFVKSTTAVDISVRSLTRTSLYKSKLVQF